MNYIINLQYLQLLNSLNLALCIDSAIYY